MTISKYAKLNCDIMDSRWYRKSSPAVRLCWHYLILHVKAFGLGGVFRPLDTERFAETWKVEESDVLTLIERAKDSNALRCDSDAGEWELTGWSQHQGDSTGAERQRRHREKQRVEPKSDDNSNGRNALQPLRNTEEKRREEKKGEDISTNVDNGDESPKPKKKRFVIPTVQEVTEYLQGEGHGTPEGTAKDFWDYWQTWEWKRKGTQMSDWRASVRTWVKNEQKFSRTSAPVNAEQARLIREMQ